jgi:ACS family pantothenate transporter-like MFS transporter
MHTKADVLEVSASSNLSTESHELDDIKPWKKPGFIGCASRAHRTLQRYVWDDPDKPRDEKWFLFKLDLFLLTSSCLGYFSKNLDQANIGNAYVSGVGSSFYFVMVCMVKSLLTQCR